MSGLRVLMFGASGMVGYAVLRECLQNPDVSSVLSVSRRSNNVQHPKYQELLHSDLFDLQPVAAKLAGFDACFYTIGVSSAGMKEGDYTRTTFDLTKSVFETLLPRNPAMAVVFVSGRSSDSTEKGRVMWARVKGRAENLLLRMPFKSVTIVRLAGLVPAPGGSSSTTLYRMLYGVAAAVLPVLHKLMPDNVTTPTILGRAFIRAAQGKAPKPILESADIHALGSAA
jgi:nucleoside-diphosphate-sugar epimerase